MLILALLLFGIFVGGIAQLLLGTPMKEINWGFAVIAGLLGSFVGGLLISFISGDGLNLRPSGLIGSVVGALLISLAYGAYQKQQKS
ncbi:MAG TPA: GlsB/YeaQ/YmgE family stress response membrane protein [Marmoricola sp.]|nr:GlsB/YeaQ/YmgE family stress response membrane protein [Marmoricola sp.]HNN48196.1 GlsB/YeaQ/YmgE family stress response membrane protein [Marmoricola sp.]HNO40135.1 GlsB/YeaQ/YmgE family stress response membrane protein [Marmoricola sp.]